MTILQARLVIHAPEAFSKATVREAVQFVASSQAATVEDRFWADAASDI